MQELCKCWHKKGRTDLLQGVEETYHEATGRIQKRSNSLLDQGGITELTEKKSIELTVHNHYHEFITSPKVLPAFRSPWTESGRADTLGEYMVAVQGILPIPREYRKKVLGVVFGSHLDNLDFLLGPVECNELTEIGVSTISGSFQNGIKHSISSFDDVKEILRLVLKSGSERFISQLKNDSTEEVNFGQPLRIVAHTSVVFGCCEELDSLENALKDSGIERGKRSMRANLKRLRLLENDTLVLSIHEYDNEISSSGSSGIPDYEVISGIGFDYTAYFAHTFLVVTESHDEKFLKALEDSIHAFFDLGISMHNHDSIRWSLLKCIGLMEELPNTEADDFKSISRVHDKLVKIHVTLSKLRRSQLLTQEWNSGNITLFERSLDALKNLGPIFDYSNLLEPTIEVYNLAEVMRRESTLEKRLDSLENAVQMRSEMTSSLIGLKTEERFGLISIILGTFVVFEVLGTYISWAFRSSPLEDYWPHFLWAIVIVFPVLMVLWLVYPFIKRKNQD